MEDTRVPDVSEILDGELFDLDDMMSPEELLDNDPEYNEWLDDHERAMPEPCAFE